MFSLSSLIPPQFKAYLFAAKIIIVISAASAIAVFSYMAGEKSTKSVYEEKLAKTELQRVTEIAAAQSEYIALKEKYEHDTSKVEVEYYNALSEIDALKSKPVVVTRLYDPGAKKSSCKSTESTARESAGIFNDGPGDDGSELSEEAERFLQEEAARADIEVKKCNLFRVKAHKWAEKSVRLGYN